MNSFTSAYVSSHFLSRVCTKFLKVNTIFISKMVSVLLLIPITANWSLVRVLRTWIILFASLSIFPKDALAFWFSNRAKLINLIFSWMVSMDFHWTVMDWPILAHKILLTSARVLSRVSSFSNYFIFFSRAFTSLVFSATSCFDLSYFSSI